MVLDDQGDREEVAVAEARRLPGCRRQAAGPIIPIRSPIAAEQITCGALKLTPVVALALVGDLPQATASGERRPGDPELDTTCALRP